MNSNRLHDKNVAGQSLSSPGFAVTPSCRDGSCGQPGSIEHMQWTSSKLTSDDVYMCRSLVTRISGLPLPKMPHLKQLKTAFEMSDEVSREAQQLAPDMTEAPGSLYPLFRDLKAGTLEAVYFRTDNVIAFHYAVQYMADQLPSYPLSDKQDYLRSRFVHELTHAAQAQNFPALFDEFTAVHLQERQIQWPELTITSPVKDLLRNKSGFYEAVKKFWMIDRSAQTGARFLTEGHATWVERQVNDRLFPGKERLEEASAAALKGSSVAQMIQSVTKSVTFAPRYVARTFCPPNPYEMGHQIFCEIYALQAELEAAPFVAKNGEAAEISPHLRGHGLAYEVLRTPGWFAQIAPGYANSWRGSLRSEINLEPLRQWATSPENTVPFVPRDYVGANPVALQQSKSSLLSD